MSDISLWLDLHLSPTTIKRQFLSHISLNGASEINQQLYQLLNQHELLDINKQNSNLVDWLADSQQGFIPYPDLPCGLTTIAEPPAGLFYRGNIELLKQTLFAIVGSRKPTPAGCENTREFSAYLAKSGVIIVSGLATGIDTIAHATALACETPTIAVLGQGLNHSYPKSNRALQQQISDKGLLLSEYLPEQTIKPWQFPQRNRLISAMSEGVLVTEAATKSGSLVTANLAADQGRQVFAIPGDIHNPTVSGCHQLIREGAQLITHPKEILEAIYWSQTEQLELITPKVDCSELSEMESIVFKALDRTPRQLDIVVARTESELTLVLDALFSLELKGMIISSIDGYYKPQSR